MAEVYFKCMENTLAQGMGRKMDKYVIKQVYHLGFR